MISNVILQLYLWILLAIVFEISLSLYILFSFEDLKNKIDEWFKNYQKEYYTSNVAKWTWDHVQSNVKHFYF